MKRWIWALPMVVLISLSFAVGGAWGQSVVINGVPLVTTRTPVTYAGTMLLPMRDVFEALQSTVKWLESEQKITATRGDTVIELWIGRTKAQVNGRPYTLPVAPTLIGGSTYVPLRFPAEAFGGTVKWDNATRTALIEIPPLQGAATPTVPPTTTVPQPTIVAGTVLQIVPEPAAVVLQPADNAGLVSVQIARNTVLTRGPEGAQSLAATVADIRVGDYAQATLAQGNVAFKIALTYGSTTGTVATLAGNTVVLSDGRAFRLSDQVRVTDANGRSIPLTSIGQNCQVQIIFDPRSKTVYELRTTAAAAVLPVQPVQAQPQIMTVGLVSPTTYFRRGDIMQLQLTGTPGGQATISLGPSGRIARDLLLQEVQPGVYQARVSVPQGPDVKSQPITGNLSLGGVRATSVVSQTCFTIDNTPPVITGMLPADGQVIGNTTPAIQASFQADAGAPLDLRAMRVLVNGVDVSDRVQRDEEGFSYTPETLAPGPVRVEVILSDLACNESRVAWTFTIGSTGDSIIGAVWSNARGTLVAGNVLAVNARVFNPGGVATFSIGDLVHNVPMRQVASGNTYRGTYTIRVGDRADRAVVRVDYRDPQGRQGTMDATGRVSIDTYLPTALAITAPVEGTSAGDVLIVKGQAPPAGSVRVTVNFTVKLLTQIAGQLWQGTVTANNHGEWTTPEIGTSLVLGRPDSYTVLAELIDANGRTISQQQLRLTR